ncbi:MAG: hypothetical protein K2Y42_20295 [Hyphomicrobium sp.]|jgi:hypothetical protein|uniref:hypothetical protein n=1 Tax=Hyphomicrobium sp. TaxID=82 RepID=UPI0025C26364|nr:hypothetical protein [Hyphomicrobium sp.]MBX9865089.1 hypothetical protein [Hyphomicrobium sp.]
MSRASLAVALLLAATGVSYAQQKITWKQTIDLPKGQNISRERADMLGIEFGDSYAEAKAKLEKLAAEGIQQTPAKPAVREMERIFQMQVPGASQVMTAGFVASLRLERRMPGAGKRTIEESITVYLSAPSSGNQVVAMERFLHYSEADQPRISEVLAQLKAKFKADPQVASNIGSTTYVYQFNDGQSFIPSKPPRLECTPALNAMENIDGIRYLNQEGECDVVFRLAANHGISRDHASSLNFSFGDNARIKAYGAADFAYVEGYIRSLQERTRGAPPKL